MTTSAQTGTVVVNTNVDADAVDGACSLREALIAINTSAARNECPTGNIISFSADFDITMTAPLPPLTRSSITIESGGFEIILRGSGAGSGSGLTITSANNIVRGLSIVQFSGSGIVLDGAGATNNTVESCFIGMTPTATDLDTFLGNQQSGILITDGASSNRIGSTTPTRRNRIGFNGAHGIHITGVDTDDNFIQGNNIGLNLDTTTRRPNVLDGIRIDGGASANQIGGTGSGEYNIIGNNTVGVNIFGTGTDDNVVIDNRIGVDFSTANPPATNARGVSITSGAQDNIVRSNIISNNLSEGVVIEGFDTRRNTLQENTIANNGGGGIRIDGGAVNNRIENDNRIRRNGASGILIASGSNTRITGNIIRLNTGTGVTVQSGIDNRISQNNISDNSALGIDLNDDGITPNDAGDVDTGPNNLQNFPSLQYAVDNGTNTFLVGALISPAASGPYTLEAFTTDGTGTHGQGRTYRGSSTPTTGAAPRILATLASGLTGSITTTATSSAGSTSEFSNNVTVENLRAAFTANPTFGTAPLTVRFTNQSTGNIGSYTWNFGNGTTSTAVNPTTVYATPGTYTVTLTARHVSGLVTATATATITVNAANPTAIFTATETLTPLPTFTATLTATNTLRPTNTATATNTPRPTNTATATNTLRPTNTPRPTNTETFTPQPTNTPRPTNTLIPTNTPQPTNTPIPTNTPAPTITPSSTPLPPDISVEKEPQDDDTYTIIIENQGGDVPNVIVEERLRPGVVYVSSIPGSPICTERAGVILCTLGTILGGASARIDVTVFTDGTDITSGQTTVRVPGQTVVIDEPFISKASQPPFAAPGERVTYTINVINPTDRAFENVQVVDAMPQAVSINDATATAGDVSVSGQDIRFTLAQLAPRQRLTITINGTLNAELTQTEIVNRACLTYTGSRGQRCAAAGFFRASALPNTGESQRTLHLLIAGIGFGGIIGFSWLMRQALKR